MAFAVRLYSHSKKDNSTSRPSGTGQEFSCILKHGSGILKPVISLDLGLTTDPSDYNYAYIPVYGRYYYIDEWFFEDALWSASLEVDVLATYKGDIGSSTLYVLRSANAFDGRIVDNLYPQKTGCNFSTVYADELWTMNTGRFVIGVANQFPTVASLCYYVLTIPELQRFNRELMSLDFLSNNGFVPTPDFDLNIQKAWVNPIQFIKTAVYIPYSVSGSLSRRIDINGWAIDSMGAQDAMYVTDTVVTINRSFNIPKHPDANSKGVYLNSSPFTIATLTVPPFGCIDLDTSIMANANVLRIEIKLDCITGLGIMTVRCNNVVMNRIEAQVGVPISLSQISRDYVGMATSILGGVTGLAGSALSGNIVGAVGSTTGAIGDAIRSAQPRSQSIGGGGGFGNLYDQPRLDMQFFRAVDDDPVHNGRPLCQNRQLSSLGDYMLIQDGDVPITGTRQEAERIKAFLEGGFYYE